MKLSLALLSLFLTTIAAAQNSPVSKRIDTIHSGILHEDRYIWVHAPPAKSKKPHTVIYLLDGEIHFNEVNDILRRLSRETGTDYTSEMIIVGIGNIWERYKDYSPTHIESSPSVDDHTAKTTGGNETFIQFLEKELFPHIKTNYPASATRMLIGHSMGGLAVMNILLKHPGLFDHYAAIDPSMWWDDMKLLQESKTIWTTKSFANKSLFIAVANTMGRDMNVGQIEKDTSAKTVLIRPSLTLINYIKSNNQKKLRFEWKFYPDHHHMTVPAPAMYDALKFFLLSPGIR